MIIRKLRLQRGWSQDQLAQLSGVSVRTIQRMERGHNAGLETLKSLAAVFDVAITDLQQEPNMQAEQQNPNISITAEEESALSSVREIKSFYQSLITYVLVISGLFVINYLSDPSYWWAVWPALGWGLGILVQASSAFEWFNFFGPDWEKRQVEKKLGRKL